MQTGSKEISDIPVNEALMDPKKDIDDQKKNWFDQVESDSEEGFNIAKNAIQK